MTSIDGTIHTHTHIHTSPTSLSGFLLPPIPSASRLNLNRHHPRRPLLPPLAPLRVSTLPLGEGEEDHHGDLEAMVPEEFHMAASVMGGAGAGRVGGTPIDR